jgi:uncharacterized protein DUF5060/cellulase (glycosyl hydrolase family 5)
MIEASFELPQVHGNPFDFTQNDVIVKIIQPDGSEVTVPAFFDGGQTWRVRHTPGMTGKYRIGAVTLDGRDAEPLNLQPREFSADGPSRPGFVRLDPSDNKRFILDDGSPYYPVGYNLGWRTEGAPPLVDSIARMGKAGINWTRIWMCHWDGKDLAWPAESAAPIQLGNLSLPTAKLWDQIVAAADAADIHFHLVLQHHGQYSTKADPNWPLNPWNKANGGWLEKPEQFFTDPKAIALTRAKFRYIVARWGYSPAIMAWELFNEVEFTDAYTNGKVDDIAAWHAAMAKFIREQDPYHHLIVTSSKVAEPKLWGAVDYYEAHVYPPDVLSGIAVLDADRLDRAYFYGELGLLEDPDPKSGDVLHRVLWGSIMSGSSAAAQYWSWDVVEANNLLFHYTAAQKFIAQSGLLRQRDMKPIEVVAETASRGPLQFGPGTSWAPAKLTEFTIKPSGTVLGLGGMSAYLQGSAKNKAMCPYVLLHVNYLTPGSFAVEVDQTTPDGARLEIKLDGQPAAAMNFGPYSLRLQPGGRPGPGPNPHPHATLELPISQGEHTIRLENTGADWAHINKFVLTPCAPGLAVLAKRGKNLVVLWVYNRAPAAGQSVAGQIRVPGLPAGLYNVAWMDTRSGNIISQTSLTASGDEPLTVDTPPIASDMAAWISRAN